LSIPKLNEILTEKVFEIYELREKEFTTPLMRQIETMIVLRVVDREWKDNLRRLDELKQGIGLRAYGQKDPLMEYHFEAKDLKEFARQEEKHLLLWLAVKQKNQLLLKRRD
jgi:preprotein translocase subunit SecA